MFEDLGKGKTAFVFTDGRGIENNLHEEGRIISLHPPKPKPGRVDAQALKEGLLFAGRGEAGTAGGARPSPHGSAQERGALGRQEPGSWVQAGTRGQQTT